MKKLLTKTKQFFAEIDFSKRAIVDYLLILLGAFIQALALRLFLVPSDLVSGGISGLAQLINHYTNFPIGMIVLLGNIPLFILGWQHLGGPRFAIRTLLSIVAFSLFIDTIVLFLPDVALTEDLVLNTLYGGLLMGIGLGIVYRGRGTSGGTDILGRILNRHSGITISQAYLITDSLVVLGAGFIFGWSKALYGLVLIYVSGLAAEVALQGTNIIRTAMIVTSETETVTHAIMHDLERGVTILSGTGGYTGEPRAVIYCTVSRMEINRLKILVHDIDPRAFMVIGQAQEALGEGFKPLKEED
ncbi:MAG: YitT family protein [Brevefilum sp.]|nr:YitT family protein [Brevefilum sp.]MDT8382088.1 YitT family protein [Brevefilum sp.]MDW7755707.1 YitT family protein [Brevefilum sp.]